MIMNVTHSKRRRILPEYQNIKYELMNHIAVITIDHPPANTWNLATLNEFEEAIGLVENDGNVRVLVITGAGEKCFSAGFDVSDAVNAPIISPKARALWRRIDRISKPVIAAINGHALGGGLELAISCHFRIMADAPSAMVGLTELNLGIIPGWGGSQRLSRIVGRSAALEMILLSKKLTAHRRTEDRTHHATVGSWKPDVGNAGPCRNSGRSPPDRRALRTGRHFGRALRRTRCRAECGSPGQRDGSRQ